MLYLKQALSVALLSVSLLSVNIHAEQSYQEEYTVGYEKEDADTSTDKIIGLSAEIYFSLVNTENKPLAQAAFLDKSSSVIVGYIKGERELQNANVNSIDTNGPLIEINYITDTDAFILGALYFKQDLDTDPVLVKGDSKTIGITIGKYLNDSSAVKFSYASSDIEVRNFVSTQASSEEIDYYELSYKTVQSLGTTSYFSFSTGIELRKAESASVKEDNHELAFLGEYYFNRMTSLGVAASFNSGDNVSDEGKTFGIGVTHFFIPQFALNIDMSRFNADDSQTEDADSISVEAIARF